MALDRLVALLDADDEPTVNTSMRLPTSLRDAAALAVEHFGAATSTTALTSAALRSALESAALRAALDLHYRRYPQARPSLADIALALARQDGSPLAEQPEVIERAAREVVVRRPDADADDVLLWAEASLAAAR